MRPHAANTQRRPHTEERRSLPPHRSQRLSAAHAGAGKALRLLRNRSGVAASVTSAGGGGAAGAKRAAFGHAGLSQLLASVPGLLLQPSWLLPGAQQPHAPGALQLRLVRRLQAHVGRLSGAAHASAQRPAGDTGGPAGPGGDAPPSSYFERMAAAGRRLGHPCPGAPSPPPSPPGKGPRATPAAGQGGVGEARQGGAPAPEGGEREQGQERGRGEANRGAAAEGTPAEWMPSRLPGSGDGVVVLSAASVASAATCASSLR